MTHIPVLVITNAAIATDGGSIFLIGVTAEGAPLRVLLDNSVSSWRAGKRSLQVNERPTPIGSAEEEHWLTALESARFQHTPLEGETDIRPSQDELNAGLARQVRALIEQVRSHAYQHQKPPPPPPPPLEDQLRALLLDGKDLDALKLYRKAHPDVSLSDAKATLQKLKNRSAP